MKSKRRAYVRQFLTVIRRGHLYFGLLLMPWALLYGITGYLFNHPTHFAESTIRGFGRDAVHGTEMEQIPDPERIAQRVVDALNQRFEFEAPLIFKEGVPAKYEGDFFIASTETSDEIVQLLLFRNGDGGTLRFQKKVPKLIEPEQASFQVTPTPSSTKSDPVRIENGLDRLCKNSLPTICERLNLGLKVGAEFKVTTAPELVMRVLEGEKDWTVRYNTVNGAVSAQRTDLVADNPVSWRRFLTRLHLAHGYPAETNVRWFWAIVVDVMAFVLIFWGVSGLVMWWQIKRTRPWGTVALIASLALATVIAGGMLPTIR